VTTGQSPTSLSKSNVKYEAHAAKVKKECPADKLLVYEVSEGWEPLCKFLGKPIPKEPFPHLNETASFQAFFTRLNVFGYVLFFGLLSVPVVVGVVAKRFISSK